MNIAMSSDKSIKLSNKENHLLPVEGGWKKKGIKVKLFSGFFGVLVCFHLFFGLFFLRVAIKLVGSLHHLSSKYDRCKQLKFQVGKWIIINYWKIPVKMEKYYCLQIRWSEESLTVYFLADFLDKKSASCIHLTSHICPSKEDKWLNQILAKQLKIVSFLESHLELK